MQVQKFGRRVGSLRKRMCMRCTGGPFLSGRMVACAASPGARLALLSMRRRQVLPFARLRQEAAHLDHAGVVELCVLRHQDRVARVGAWSGFGFRFGARVWVRVGVRIRVRVRVRVGVARVVPASKLAAVMSAWFM